MKLALAQIEIEPGAYADNLDRAKRAVADAASAGADLVALPEMFTVGYFAFDLYARLAEPIDGETIGELSAVARTHDVAIVAGTFVEDLAASRERGFQTPASDGFANTAVFLDRFGDRRAVYRKHHLFGYESAEAELLEAGQHLPTVEFEGFTVGMTTCYDLRFPELYRNLAGEGVTLTVVPSAWPYPRVEHWSLFPRTRAVENLSYVAAVNGVGSFDDATLLGRSRIYDPWGNVLGESGDEPATVTAKLDPARVDAVREEFPALEDRRRDL